ncbi:MAG: acyltransferase [Akkermansia sp.]|nr:acyltransferase [Akkermansia sp.]MBQ9836042.1 acyltransferase [Akkermansia sp.]
MFTLPSPDSERKSQQKPVEQHKSKKNLQIEGLRSIGLTNPAKPAKRIIESLYVLKAICAFFVISIHVTVIIPHTILQPIAGVGTPCFLCITGYLLYSANRERELGKCVAWAKKCFWLALVFNLFYAVVAYFFYPAALYPWTLEQCLRLFVLGRGIQGSNLWYLTALWEALLVMWLILKYAPGLIRYLPLLFIIAFICRNVEAIPTLTEKYRLLYLYFRLNMFAMSLPFLATGYLIHKYQDKILNSIKVEVCLLSSFLLIFAECLVRKKTGIPCNYFFLFTYPFVVFLILLCIKYQNFTLPIIGAIGKHHSPNIYYFHGFYIWLLSSVCLPLTDSFIPSLCIYIACLPLSFGFNIISKYWITKAWKPLQRTICSYTEEKT